MSSPLLCITVAGPDMAALRRHRDEAAAQGADLVELRLDLVADPDVTAALADRSTPVIVTCRAPWEGGQFKGSEEERQGILKAALAQGAEYVDVEFKAGFAGDLIGSSRGRRIVLSMHDFDGVPGDLPDRVRAMRSAGADVVKVAVQAQSLFDNLSLLELRDGGASRCVFVGMGPCGLPTRLLPAHFGSEWSYAGDAHAPGQMSAESMIKEFRYRENTEQTALYGIVGYPLGHSLSPAMHNAAFRAAGMDAVYVPMPAANADDFLEFAKALHVRGASVTIPYKVDLFKRVDAADQVSTQVGAVNTLKRRQTKWLGRNTDVNGFLAPLRGRHQLRGMRAAVLGAGGAARGVAVALSTSGAEVSVYARNPERAAEVSRLVNRKPTGRELPAPKSWDLIVNATPIGAYPDVGASPMPAEGFDGRIAYDLVYNPAETQFLKHAAAMGCETIGGLDMLVAQAEDQSEWWIGRRPPAGLMREAAMARL